MSDYLPALPDEVVAGTILWRLPIKSIIQCRCVCKSWYSLITSPYFISTHLLKTLTPKNTQIFLNEWDCIDETGRCLLHFDCQDYIRSMLFHLPHPRYDHHSWIKVVGSVNGLICFSIGQGGVSLVINLVICNPSIGHFISIHPPESSSSVRRRWEVRGFGFDDRTQDYIILLIIPGRFGFIYSFNLKCWRKVTRRVPKNWNTQCDSVVFVNGRFHWLVIAARDRGRKKWFNFIMVFDVKREAFDCILLPKYVARCPSDIFYFTEYGESSIAVIQQTGMAEGFVTHVWIMKEYGSVDSWIKLTVGNPQVAVIEYLKQDHVLGFMNKDQVLIRYASGCIASRKINNNDNKFELEEIKKIMDVDNHPSISFSVHKYMPSLVLLDRENNVDVAAPTHTKRLKLSSD